MAGTIFFTILALFLGIFGLLKVRVAVYIRCSILDRFIHLLVAATCIALGAWAAVPALRGWQFYVG